jgi:hypothetical protein
MAAEGFDQGSIDSRCGVGVGEGECSAHGMVWPRRRGRGWRVLRMARASGPPRLRADGGRRGPTGADGGRRGPVPTRTRPDDGPRSR